MNVPDSVSACDNRMKTLERQRVTLYVGDQPILSAHEAATFFSRLRGLHAYLPLDDDEALIIKPCRSIHTFSMSKSIDVIFLSKTGVILEMRTLERRRWCAISKAAAVLEMNAGVCKTLGIKIGMRIGRDIGEWT